MFSLTSKNVTYKKSWYFILILSVSYLFIPNFSFAAITCVGMPSSITSNFSVKIQRDYPVGHKTPFLNESHNIHCRGPISVGKTIIFKLINKEKPQFVTAETFESGLSGLGLKITRLLDLASSTNCSEDLVKLELKCKVTKGFSDSYIIFRPSMEAGITKLNMNYAVGSFDFPLYDWLYYMESDGPSTAKAVNGSQNQKHIHVTSNSCSLDTPVLNFDLDEIEQRHFTSIGPKNVRKKQFIDLTCDPNVIYSLQIDGIAEQNYPGVIKLIPGPGAATGVGVQLLAADQEIEIGKAKRMGTSDNNGRSSGQYISITARYYQTDNKVTPGIVKATATFTMTYQ
ncbi:type 1 fimbrial protein [Yersinia canariae]|uniref:Type 1 fimbrial protein n=1 Tax=Yersinia canariae TaxID=2607663 RepID=A0A857EYB9_9GAMM|nr:fimbrial protein [Yersinia canariae]QHB31762.1 type 1 fimbrial protein [Yersinia canariae]